MLPILFNGYGITIYSYPLFMGMAWGLAYKLTSNILFKLEDSTRGFNGLFLGVFISSWIGSKLFFLLNPPDHHHIDFINSSSFWLGGGFVFYGGMVFGAIYILIYCLLLKRFSFVKCAYFVPAIAFAHGIGRIGCFLTGCCYGVESPSWWAVMLHQKLRHPVQLYEATGLFAIGAVTYWLLKHKHSKSVIIRIYLTSYSMLRFVVEFFRGDSIRGKYGLLSTSQWISLFLLLLLIVQYMIQEKESKNG